MFFAEIRSPYSVFLLGENAIIYCDSILNGVLIRTGQQRSTRIGSLYGRKYGYSGKFQRELRGKTDLGSFVIYNVDYQYFYKE